MIIRKYGYLKQKHYFLTIIIILVFVGSILPAKASNQSASYYSTKWASQKDEIIWKVRQAGGDDKLLWIIEHESNFNPLAYNKIIKDRGLFQLNSYYYKNIPDECAYNVDCSITEAVKIYNKRGPWEWSAYKKYGQ